jgi:hypothetical protein
MSVNSPLREPYKIKNSIIQEKKRHTVKALVIVCLVTGLILGVYCGKGRLHDFALFKKYRLKVDPKIAILADLGFLGIAKFHSNSWLPFKKSKNKPLTKAEKQANREQARQRVGVEHRNRDCKIFRIVKDVYRGKHKNYGINWNLVAGLVNFKSATNNLNLARP